MSNLKSVNFYDLCRVCTATTDQKIDIFSAEGRTKNLTVKLMECLSLNVDEFDRLPKVLCQQCQNNLDTFSEFRNICRSSQNMLSSCLASAQNGGKVLVKDMLSSSGKSLSVLNNVVSNSVTVQQPQSQIQPPPPLTTQTQQSQIQQHPVFSLQGSNLVAQAITSTGSVQNQDFLNSIMQAVGIQTENIVKAEKSSLPQYTITVDNSLQQPPQQQQQQLQQQTNQSPGASVKEKDLKTNTLEEFLKMKPNIKITPIGKKNQQQQQQLQQQAQQDQLLQQQQQEQQQQQQQHQHQLVQLQLQQLQQQLQQQLHQQQLQQQLQLLTSQLQPQQITITAPTLQPHPQPSQQQLTQGTLSASSTDNTIISHPDTEDSSPSKNKKPKLNFVLTPPHNNTNITAAIPQLTTTVNPHTSLGPQIQLQLHPTLTQQAMMQQNHHNPNTTAALLSNLAPLLQPQTQLNAALQSQLASVAQNSSTNMLSPNKCFLPITIKDENTDQQFVAHIDAKNFLLPTTYQLQMKLQPQIATADGQPIMQLAPTSIPATLQLTPQALGANQTFQAATTVASLNTNHCALNSNQDLPAQTMQQTQPSVATLSTQMKQPMTPNPVQTQLTPTQQTTHQSTHQSYKQIPSNISKTVQITSQQVINPANVKQEPQSVTAQEADKQKFQISGTAVADNIKVVNRQKYKISQQPGANAIEITPTTSFTQQIMQQVQQQQQQKLQQQISPTTTTVTTQHGSITAHITTKTNQNPAAGNGTIPSETVTHSTTPANSNVSQTVLPTLPILNKNNITISRVTRQNQPNKNKPTAPNNQTMKVASSIPATTTLKVVAQQQHNRQSIQTPIANAKTPQHQAQSLPTTQVQQNQLPTQKPQAVSNIPNTTLRISPTKKFVAQIQKPVTEIIVPERVSELIVSDQNSNSRISASTQRTAPPPRPSIEADPVVDSSVSESTAQTGNIIECSQCGRIFKKKEHLTQHLKLHTGVRPFKCNEEGCPKAFHRKEHLLRHLVSHSGKKMFNCDICQKPFSRKDNLSKHRKIHNDTSTSNYVCDICNKSFAVKAYYTQHKLLHKTKGLPPEEDSKTEETNQNKSNNNEQQNQTEFQNEQQSAMLTQPTMISQQHEQQHQNPTIHLVQQLQHQPGQPQIMHLQLPTSMVTTQDLAGNTITITQASNNPNANTLKGHDATVLNLPTSLANYVQLSQAQFVNAATGQIMGHLKIEK